MHQKALGAKLRALRAERGIDQDQVAEGTGLTQSTVSRLENGDIKKPGVFDVHALAHYYDVSLDGLMDGLPIPRLRPVSRQLSPQVAALATAVQEALAILSAAIPPPAPVNTAEHDDGSPNVDPTANYVLTGGRELAVAR